MRYYCEHCKSEYVFGPEIIANKGNPCFICNHPLSPIPDYETPEQYEQRTGVPWPDDGAVWVFYMDTWFFHTYYYVKGGDDLVVIADPPLLPPDDWRPE